MTGPGPLAGIKVLDLTSVVVGPSCTLLLAQQGAEIIKLEPPEGDLLRKLGGKSRTPGMAPKFLHFNRGKHSICVDLKLESGRAATRISFLKMYTPSAANRTSPGRPNSATICK